MGCVQYGHMYGHSVKSMYGGLRLVVTQHTQNQIYRLPGQEKEQVEGHVVETLTIITKRVTREFRPKFGEFVNV